MMQLDLLTWKPSTKIIPFPSARRTGKVRRTAEVLATKHGRGADAYWRQVIAAMRSQMEAASIPDDDIVRELRAFADAVFVEMRGRPMQPGGDAA